MKILVVDCGGVGLAFCLRCSEYGHDIFWYVDPKVDNNPKQIGLNMHPLIRKVDNWVSEAAKADLIFATENGDHLEKLDFFRKRGVPVYAPTPKAANLEINRKAGMDFLKKHGIEVPMYHTFKTLKEAEQHVWDNPQPWVFKTLGDNDDKALSYVGKTPEQMIQQLRTWQQKGMNPKGDVMLQEKIDGVEFGVSRWIGKDGFIGTWCENFEHKKLMPGEIGVNTGEMGTVSKYVRSSKLGEEILLPLEKDLAELGCYTDVDLNCIIDKEGKVYPLEFTMRPGWPIFNMQLFAHRGDPADWMVDACHGIDSLKTSLDTLIGVVLTIPDFPYCHLDPKECSDIPIYGITKELESKIQPQAIKKGKFVDDVKGTLKEVDGWVTAGNYVAVVVDKAKTIVKAQDKVYSTIDKLSMSNMIYRYDIGDKCKVALLTLQDLGYAEDWEDATGDEE